MTSFSGKESKSATPELFTIPENQMSHVQVVTVEPVKLARVLRLTGAVAYNAFNTTPVITQVGGPVSRILVVPGERVKKGQPLLEVSSPDYSLLYAAYLKARDTFRVADKNYARAQDLYAHHAIAERDLLQAESDRIQAQADLNAALLGLKILGIPNPDDLEKAPSSAEIPLLAPIGGEIVERDVAPGQLLQAGATQAFIISDMSSVWVLANVYQSDMAAVHVGDQVDGADRFLSRQISGKDFVHLTGAGSQYAHAAGAHRGGKSRRKTEEQYVRHGHGECGRGAERHRRAGFFRAARRRKSAVRLRSHRLQSVRPPRRWKSARAKQVRRKF